MLASSAIDGVVARVVDLDGLSTTYLTAGPNRRGGSEPTEIEGSESGSVENEADGESAPPIVLLHGGGLDRAALSWKHAIPALAADRRVYAPDWPGFGDSDPPDVPKAEVTTDYFVSVLDRFREALRIEEVALCGISMGGGVALGYALAHPEHVSRVALIDSYGLGGDVPGDRLAAGFVRSPLPGDLVTALLRRSRRLTALSVRAIVAPGNGTESLVDEVYGIASRPGAADAWQAFQRNEVGVRGLRTNYLDRLPDLSVPALLVHGERDLLVPVKWTIRAGTLIPDCEVRIIPRCGHWPPRERPETTNEYLRTFYRDR